MRHILLLYLDYAKARIRLINQTGTENLEKMLTTPASAKAAARWLISCALLPQFNVAKEIGEEDTTRYTTPQDLGNWI